MSRCVCGPYSLYNNTRCVDSSIDDRDNGEINYHTDTGDRDYRAFQNKSMYMKIMTVTVIAMTVTVRVTMVMALKLDGVGPVDNRPSTD